VPLRAFGVVESLLLSLIQQGFRTWGEFGFKLSLWRFTFLNYTKSTKYEALEKNAATRRQIARLSTLKYSLVFRKAQLY
jgi:hypothetical protein